LVFSSAFRTKILLAFLRGPCAASPLNRIAKRQLRLGAHLK
jgi:hypothetical protein